MNFSMLVRGILGCLLFQATSFAQTQQPVSLESASAVYCRANNAFMSGLIEIHVDLKEASQVSLVYVAPGEEIILSQMSITSKQLLAVEGYNEVYPVLEIKALSAVDSAGHQDKIKSRIALKKSSFSMLVASLAGPVLESKYGQELELLKGGYARCGFSLSEIRH